MILPIGKWLDETTGEYKDRFLVLGMVMKDADYRTVGAKQTPMLTLIVSPGRGEDLVNIKMWSYEADKHRGVKKFRTVFADVYAETREYQGKTYTNYTPLTIMFDGAAFGEPAPQKRTRKSNTVEPQSQADEEGFFDIQNKDDLPF